jgi:hypothetical protein
MRRLGLVIVAVILSSACGADRPNLVDHGLERQVGDPSPAASDTVARPLLRLAVDGWTGDPADAGPADLGRRVVADLLYEGLTYMDSGGVAQPALADRWSVSVDRLTWVFTMSPDAVDGAGNPITARTAMWSLDHVAARGADDLVASSLAAIEGWDDRMNGRAGGVAGITAPSDSQLVVRLERPFEPLLEVLASPALGIFVAADMDRSTGAYRVDPPTGELWPVDEGSSLPRIELVDADAAEGAGLLRADKVDWTVLAPDTATDDLPGDVVRLPLDVTVGLAVRLGDARSRRALALALDSVALAGVIGISPTTPRFASPAAGEAPPFVTVDVPAGVLEPLGSAVADQLSEAGVASEVFVSDAASFAERILGADAMIHPLILAGGTWSAEAVAGALVPGGVDDLVAIESADRTSLGESLVGTRDLENRRLFADLLVQTAVDEGVLVLLGRIEARVGVSAAAAGLRHRTDGTLDLSGFG